MGSNSVVKQEAIELSAQVTILHPLKSFFDHLDSTFSHAVGWWMMGRTCNMANPIHVTEMFELITCEASGVVTNHDIWEPMSAKATPQARNSDNRCWPRRDMDVDPFGVSILDN